MMKDEQSSAPSVSVIMSAYNAENDIAAAIESILAQTYTDFEFIVIDDGSKDKTAEIVERYAAQDERIRFCPQENTGLTIALNKGVNLARGQYIARQDCDDLSYPQRFEQEVKYLEGHPDVVLVGSNANDLYPDGFTSEWGHYEDEELQKIVFLKTPFPHSTIMMRADVCHRLDGYDERRKTSQDMEMWMRLAKVGKIGMIKEPLIQRFVGEDTISAKRRWRQTYDALCSRLKHNPIHKHPGAIYYTLRGLVIGLLPHFIIKLKRGGKDAQSKTTGIKT